MEILRKLNYIFSRKQKMMLFMLAILIIIGATLELLSVAAVMPLVEVITTPSAIYNKKSYHQLYSLLNLKTEQQFVIMLICILIAMYIIKNIYIILLNDAQSRFSFNNQRRIAIRLMDCYIHQPYTFHLGTNVSEIQRNIQNDTTMLLGGVMSVVQLATEFMTCFFIGIYLVLLDKTISVSVIVLLGLFSSVFLKLSKNRALYYGEEVRECAWQLNKWVRQSFEGIKEIKVSNTEDVYLRRVDSVYSRQALVGRRKNVLAAMPRPIFEAVCISSMLALVGIKIIMGVNLQYFIPVLSAFTVAAFRLLPAFGRVTAYVNDIAYYSPAINNVYNDLVQVDELQKENINRYSESETIDFVKEIEINKVTFTYPAGESPVLEDVSFKIPKDSSVAFVGPSGAGKSTLADIILGLLTPQKGHILADGIDVFENSIGWHKILGYIPQTIYLTDDTIRDNVLFGTDDDKASDEKVWSALEKAQLAEFVRGLKDGLDTIVGERGVRLSGGQRQRIGIARALYNDPKILVLDEATSALDTETETAVMEAIDGLMGSRTIIIIAHRITTIKNCDYIFEVNNRHVNQITKAELFGEV